jgi:TonB family protein
VKEPVSDILELRRRAADGLGRMAWISVGAHLLLIVLLAAIPRAWQGGRAQEEPRVVMSISLGGPPGPIAGGMTPMGGRPIQQAVALPEAPRPEPVRPPAARTPAMTVPEPAARPAPPRTPVPSAPEESRGRTPTRGAEARPGSAIAETGGQGVGIGLTTGGGGTGGQIDIGDFCCPEYISTMLQLIRQNWNSKQQVPGETVMRFTIERDGQLTSIDVSRSSGYFALDQAARRALTVTRLPPLPAAYPEPALTVNLSFQYQR